MSAEPATQPIKTALPRAVSLPADTSLSVCTDASVERKPEEAERAAYDELSRLWDASRIADLNVRYTGTWLKRQSIGTLAFRSRLQSCR
jgi:hypothetical protein